MADRSPRLRHALGATFIFAGTMHFVIPKTYEAIMPDYLPAHRELVLASGVAEIAGGAGVLTRRWRRVAGWWLLATLVAVFPANLNMALNPDRYRQVPEALLWARLPLQVAFMEWVRRAALRR